MKNFSKMFESMPAKKPQEIQNKEKDSHFIENEKRAPRDVSEQENEPRIEKQEQDGVAEQESSKNVEFSEEEAGDQKVEKEGMTRREFLKKTGAVMAGVAVEGFPTRGVASKPEDIWKNFDLKKMENDRREKCDRFLEIVDKENTFEKLARLREKFGDSMEFIEFRNIQRDLRSLKNMLVKKKDPDVYVDHSYPIAATPGSLAAHAFEDRWERKTEKKDPKFLTVNLEKIDGLSDEVFREEVSEIYDANYLGDSVDAVIFDPEVKYTSETSIAAGESQSYGIERMLDSDDTEKGAPIKIYNRPDGMTKEKFMDVFHHEIHHANDWGNSLTLTSAERINILYDFSDRINADDRFKSAYVEGITQKSFEKHMNHGAETADPKKFTDYIKTMEYWAEAAKEYHLNKESFRENHPTDFALVEKWVKRLGE